LFTARRAIRIVYTSTSGLPCPSPGTPGEGRVRVLFQTCKPLDDRDRTLTLVLSRNTGRGSKRTRHPRDDPRREQVFHSTDATPAPSECCRSRSTQCKRI